jgi:hypothetical protein
MPTQEHRGSGDWQGHAESSTGVELMEELEQRGFMVCR